MERPVSASANRRRVVSLTCGILFLSRGIVQPDRGLVVGLSETGCLVDPPDHPLLEGPRFRGVPTMASVPEALLQVAGSKTQGAFGERISQPCAGKMDGGASPVSGGRAP